MIRCAPLLLLVACAEPIGEEPLRFQCAVREIALGRRFDLSVVRTWAKGDAPVEWGSDALALRLRDQDVREAGGRVEETRRYDAYAFGAVDVPGLDLTVRRELDPASPGAPELPEPPRGSWPWFAAAAALLLALFLVVRRRRADTAVPAAGEPEPAVDPRVAARARLAAIRAADLADGDLVREVAALVRGVAAVPAHASTEEALAAAPRDRARLAAVLRRCDRVKFARHAPGPDGRARLLDAAGAYLEDEAPASRGEPAA